MLPMRLSRSLLADVGLAVALAVFGVVGTIGADDNTGADLSIDPRSLTLVLTGAAVLVLRRAWPLITLATATVLTSAYLILGYTYGPILVTFAVAVYTVARYRPPSRSLPMSVAALAILLTHLLTHNDALPDYVALIPATAWVVVPFAIGFAVRTTHASAAQARSEVVRQRVDDERLRVAQEVHDVVGHGLAAIKMQADIALHVLPKKPEQAEIALSAISRTSTDALEELRATLAVVRHPDTDAARSPSAAGLAGLDQLVDRMRAAGVQIRLESSGPARTLSAADDLAAYRILQESLTNVLRHSDAKAATVRLRYEAAALLISVTNSVERVSTSVAGQGIIGMRQRVTALGGDFAAGPTEGGRFEVRACLPTATSAGAPA